MSWVRTASVIGSAGESGSSPIRSGGDATIADDRVTVRFPAFGGNLTEFHPAEFQEHAAYVVGRAITSERAAPKGSVVTAVGIRRRVTGRYESTERASARGRHRSAAVGHVGKRCHVREAARDKQSDVCGWLRGFRADTRSVVGQQILLLMPVDNWLNCWAYC
jgi:hypothetical protein